MTGDPIRLETWGILDAVLDDRTNLSGRWIAEGIAWYARPVADGITIHRAINTRLSDEQNVRDFAGCIRRAIAETTPPETVAIEVSILTGGEVVNLAVNGTVNPIDDKMEWLSGHVTGEVTPLDDIEPSTPATSRAKRLSRLRKAAPDTSTNGKGGGGVKWVDGELDFIRKLSPERQKVWRWCKGLTVTHDEPSCRDASAETGISQETSNKALKQYRAYHGIGQG